MHMAPAAAGGKGLRVRDVPGGPRRRPGLATYAPRPPESREGCRFFYAAGPAARAACARRFPGGGGRAARHVARPSELSVPGDRRAMSQREGGVRRLKLFRATELSAAETRTCRGPRARVACRITNQRARKRSPSLETTNLLRSTWQRDALLVY